MTDTLGRTGEALLAFADGPGQEAAKKLEDAFALAGQNIEKAMGQAAKTGQLDFEGMVASILKDLTQLASQSIFNGQNAVPSQTINLNMSMGQGANAQSILNSQGAITASLANAVQAGTRFI